MENLTLDYKVSLKQAYLIMFEYLERYYNETGQPDEIGNLLGELSLWKTSEGRMPIDGAVFPTWLSSAKKVIDQVNLDSH